MDYWSILAATLPVYLVIAAGFLLRRGGRFPSELDDGLMKLVVNVLFPCFILDALLGNPALDDAGNVVAAALSGFALILVGFGVSFAAGRAVGLRKSDGLRTFSLSTGIQNYGFIPIPLVVTLFGDEETMGVLFMHSLGVEIATWTVGLAILNGFGRAQWRQLFNGPLLAIVGGLALHASGAATLIPPPASSAIAMLAPCAIPLSLLLIGAAISDLITAGSWLQPYRRPLAACIVRLGILPVAFIATAALLPLGVELKRVLAVQAAMPCAVFSIVLARHYGGHVTTAIQVVVATSIVSIFTIPAVIGLALHILDLD